MEATHEYKVIVKLLILLLAVTVVAAAAMAWTMTPELEKEIAQKKSQVAKDPHDSDARFELAITYSYSNKIQEGLDELKKLDNLSAEKKKALLKKYIAQVKADPVDWKARFRLAFAYYFSDKKEDAIREMKYVLWLDPGNIWAYGYIALIYGEMNKIDEAIQYAKEGINLDSNVAALHLLLAAGYQRKGNNWGAVREGMEAMRLKALGF